VSGVSGEKNVKEEGGDRGEREEKTGREKRGDERGLLRLVATAR